jgi:hypothetical protein
VVQCRCARARKLGSSSSTDYDFFFGHCLLTHARGRNESEFECQVAEPVGGGRLVRRKHYYSDVRKRSVTFLEGAGDFLKYITRCFRTVECPPSAETNLW